MPVWRRALLRHRVAAGVEHAGVLRNLGAVKTVVDIGANRGQFALVARHAFPQTYIVSTEPLRESTIDPAPGEALIHHFARDELPSVLPITDTQSELHRVLDFA